MPLLEKTCRVSAAPTPVFGDKSLKNLLRKTFQDRSSMDVMAEMRISASRALSKGSLSDRKSISRDFATSLGHHPVGS